MIDPVELERLLDRELKQLPSPPAPGTLLPRVMAAARAAAPWYRRPWVTWPAMWQTASIVLLVAFVAAVASSRLFLTLPEGIAGVARGLIEGAALMRVISEVFLQPVAKYVLALAISLTAACAALWSALNRFAPGEASHQ